VFVQVSPFQSLTGANADRWIGCRPGTEAAVIMGLIRMVTDSENDRNMSRNLRTVLADLTEAYTPEAVARMSGVSVDDQAALGRQLLAAKRPLVLGTGAGSYAEHAVAAELAALFLNVALDPELNLFDFNNRHRVEIADRRSTVIEAFDAMEKHPWNGFAQQRQSGLFHSRWQPHCRYSAQAQAVRGGLFQFHG
jgi:hypothetical protein